MIRARAPSRPSGEAASKRGSGQSERRGGCVASSGTKHAADAADTASSTHLHTRAIVCDECHRQTSQLCERDTFRASDRDDEKPHWLQMSWLASSKSANNGAGRGGTHAPNTG